MGVERSHSLLFLYANLFLLLPVSCLQTEHGPVGPRVIFRPGSHLLGFFH